MPKNSLSQSSESPAIPAIALLLYHAQTAIAAKKLIACVDGTREAKSVAYVYDINKRKIVL